MASWVVMIGREHPEHWGYAVESPYWDIVNKIDIKAGDDVFFWQAKGSFISWTRATVDAIEITEDMPAAPWNDREYVRRIPFDVVSEEPLTDIQWAEFATEAGITQLPSHGQLRIPESAEEYVRSLFEEQGDAPDGDPTEPDDYPDTREKVVAAIKRRQGQQRFRTQVLDSYASTCAVTGSKVVQILEAAHIRPFLGRHSNRVTNSLLLRADLHTLFDQYLLTVDHELRVRASSDLADTEYAQYDGAPLRSPKHRSDRPKKEDLQSHYSECAWLSPTT